MRHMQILVIAFIVMISGQAFAGSTIFYKQYERGLSVQTQDGKLHDFTLELAQTPKQQEKGLQHRWKLDNTAGMLFIFENIRERSFWMRDTYIPLDIIFIDKNGKIQHIHHMAKPQDESYITSGKPVRAVLEINGGMADKLGIQKGDVVFHSIFKNLNLLEKKK